MTVAEHTSTQRFTTRDTAVIKHALRRRSNVIVLRRDREWLSRYGEPRLLLSRMAARGALRPLGGGRYAIPALGSSSLSASVSWQALVHAELEPLGPYYLGFLTALEDHRLTDLADPEITAAIGFQNSRLQRGDAKVAGRPLRVTRMRKAAFGFGIETARLSRSEWYLRSDLERTLIDCHDRPLLAGSPEIWVLAWGRAFREERVDPRRLCDYAAQIGPGAARRTGMLLSMLGDGEQARDFFPSRVRRADRQAPLFAELPVEPDHEVDPFWRVIFNLPRDTVTGWLSYGG